MATQCYVCAKHPVNSEEVERSNAIVYRVACPRCGIYDVAHRYISGERNQPSLTDVERVQLSHAIRKATDGFGRFAEELLNYETIRPLLERHPLPDPFDQADLLIDGIARRCSSFGAYTPEECVDAWAARIGLMGALELKTLYADLELLIRQKGLGSAKSATPGDLHTKETSLSLTRDGWERAREIRKDRGPGNQAFVAMWFHRDMRAIYDEGFAPALIDTGHTPYRVDLAAHEGKVDDEIIAQIRRSTLVVVDATGNRANAYYEAGFGQGLDARVIWCCNCTWTAYWYAIEPNGSAPPELKVGKWIDNLPFDTRQHSFIFWHDAADLRKQLTDRIRRLGYDRAWNLGR